MTRTDKIQRVEEQLEVAKRRVSDGQVKVRTKTELDHETVEQDLKQVTASIERIPIGLEVDEFPQIRTEGDTTIVPICEERVIVEKRLVLVEEIRIKREITVQHERVPISLRKQKFVVERIYPNSKEHTHDTDL
ncbi:YsnF/AvaK domain-containing protein [Metarhizobium album]|uniref:YsnF/AvaK domain-containing protein n=1 Tax=Metarhizobium album TaxID=2182425 RepID=UPI001401E5AD|nr:YsnF/AvaK domain-containing protein [Rhizobium album]